VVKLTQQQNQLGSSAISRQLTCIYSRTSFKAHYQQFLLFSSTPRLSLLFFVVDSVCMYICLSVCHKHCFFLFVSRWNRAISWPSVLHDKNYKTLFFDFSFRPSNAKNLLPKIGTSRLVCQIDRRCLALLGVFGNGRFNGTMQNVGRPLLPWQHLA